MLGISPMSPERKRNGTLYSTILLHRKFYAFVPDLAVIFQEVFRMKSLAVCILLFAVHAHAQTENFRILAGNTQVENPENPSAESKPTPASLQSESLDDALEKALNRQFQKIKSACEENKTPDQRIADVKEGIDELGILIEKYSPQEHRLSIKHRILLSEINNVLYSGHVFSWRSWKFTKQALQEDNVASAFITYYKFMNGLGDSIGVKDFKQQWARDFARGLSCLYPQ